MSWRREESLLTEAEGFIEEGFRDERSQCIVSGV